MFFLKELPSREILQSYQTRFPAMNVDNVHDALHMLRQASLLMRQLDNYFAANDLSTLRYLILIVLEREDLPEGLMVSELAERVDVSRPVMTRTVQTLVDDGLLATRACDNDGRIKRVRLTVAGHDTLNRVLPGYYQLIDRFMASDTRL
ncbi:MarR family winged helix-turn-helix transcriptional regulator [Paludibacterium purpuratum]|uniref:MarR family transcriptional regulator n=1 Tax=Paludibacterium purpuratum TaxID=1144873 RepID=A0A4R7B182_9NEIS|nr:MarR family transcriptional regulator [Paludibacterium purpuratum]TDR76441.1 MarR family transcriptional regulator [Paludibacterium purpuratum]